jgi:hypothetical protein
LAKRTTPNPARPDPAKLDRIVAEAHRHSDQRAATYRERALQLFPWICGRCGREFSGARLRELTVHHKDHNHDNNPPDGSNWELLCLYCHDNEHMRLLEQQAQPQQPQTAVGSSAGPGQPTATPNTFAGRQALLNKK